MGKVRPRLQPGHALRVAVLFAVSVVACGGDDAASSACADLGAPLNGCYGFSALLVQFDTRGVDPLPSTRLFEQSLPSRLYDATGGLIALRFDEVQYYAAPRHDYTELAEAFPNLREPDLPRIWYYDNGGRLALLEDIYAAIDPDWQEFDLVVVLVDTLPEALGLAPDETLSITLSYELGGWGRGGEYTSQPTPDTVLLDVAIHEIGHNFGLRHVCTSCAAPIQQECCDACAERDDVMSVCRDRFAVNVFGSCTRAPLEAAAEARSEGAEVAFNERQVCE